jgi:hypothetical protein
VEAAYQTALIRENLATLTSLQSSFSKLLTRAEFLLTVGSQSAGQ